MKNRKKYLFSFSLILFLLLGISYAFFSYTKNSDKNNQIIAGDIYFHFYETGNEVVLTNAFPETKEEARSHNDNFTTFSINGLNTYQKKNIYYEIVLIEGEEIEGKQRLNPKDIKFDLVEIIDGEENYLIQNFSYTDFNNKRIYVDTIPASITTEINRTYQLRMWVSEDVIISDTEDYADYTTDEYANSYASIKVLINGDFTEKTYESQILSTNISEKITTNGVVGVAADGESEGDLDTSREFRYSGNGKYCTYTLGETTYELNIETNYCPDACVTSTDIYNAESEHLYSIDNNCEGSIVAPNESVPNSGEVNNYIEFNNEIWRIIGVFETENAEGVVDYRVKIIRDQPLEFDIVPEYITYNNSSYYFKNDFSDKLRPSYKFNYAYNIFYDYYMNDYSKSYVMHYLNDENMVDGYYGTISKNYQDMIETVKYYLGTVDLSRVESAKSLYEQERTISCEENNTVQTSNIVDDVKVLPLIPEPTGGNLVCNVWDSNNSTWTGKIGLMYPSDFVYANKSYQWSRNYLTNWMNDNIRASEFLISPSAESWFYVTMLGCSSRIGEGYSNLIYSTLSPVLYLKADILVVGGDGTESNPYLIDYSD